MDTYIQPPKMEIKQEQDEDVELCDVNKLDVEAYIERTVKVFNNSASFQDEYLYPDKFTVKLEDASSELDLLRNTDVTKVLNDGINNERLKKVIKQEDHVKKNRFCTECHHSDCHVGVEQRDLSVVYNTQKSALMKHDVFSESVPDQGSIHENGDSFIDNLKLRINKLKQILSVEATESVDDSYCQTVNADVLTNQNDDDVKLSDDNNCQFLKYESDDSIQPVQVFTDRRVPQEIFQCPLCSVDFTDSDQFMAHKQTHTGDFLEEDYHKMDKEEKPYACDDSGFDSAYCHNLHMQPEIHTAEKPCIWEDCGLDTTNNGDLKKHTKIHSGEKPYRFDFSSTCSDKLQKHRTKHTGEKAYKCDVCSFSTSHTNDLRKHKRIHTGENPYKCDVCGIDFIRSGNLKEHKRIHTGEKPYKCDDCGLDFTRSQNLKEHKKIHTGEKLHTCNICGFSFTQVGHLKEHQKIHTGEKPYKCDDCGLDFMRRGNLSEHKRIHTGEKPYNCDICGLNFKRSTHLIEHKSIHTGEKPYKCDVCGLNFRRSTYLKQHERIHTGTNLYKCDVCGFSFTQNGHLREHKRIHTGEKPYNCDVCGFQFKRSTHLKRHKRIHTGEKP